MKVERQGVRKRKEDSYIYRPLRESEPKAKIYTVKF